MLWGFFIDFIILNFYILVLIASNATRLITLLSQNINFVSGPTGNGIQAPKIFEALLVKTIPIVENELAFYQLKELGLPIIIVDNWLNLNPDFITEQYKTFKL